MPTNTNSRHRWISEQAFLLYLKLIIKVDVRVLHPWLYGIGCIFKYAWRWQPSKWWNSSVILKQLFCICWPKKICFNHVLVLLHFAGQKDGLKWSLQDQEFIFVCITQTALNFHLDVIQSDKSAYSATYLTTPPVKISNMFDNGWDDPDRVWSWDSADPVAMGVGWGMRRFWKLACLIV